GILNRSLLIVALPLLITFGTRVALKPEEINLLSCEEKKYSTEILSIDPLIIYINEFIFDKEIDYLMKLGQPLFQDSQLFDNDQVRTVDKPYRSSSSAFLPYEDPVCQCIGQRALDFLGFVEHKAHERLQLVRYYPGQEYNLHSDWLYNPKVSRSPGDKGQEYNRLGSFFTYIGGNSTGGETYFPFVNGATLTADPTKYAISSNGQGLLVKPVKGNALFWMNLHPTNGTGNDKTFHSGLPVHSGIKYGMNLWTKHYKSMPILGPYESKEDRKFEPGEATNV
ncbi:2OG-Fe(II) oxygenase family Oxidoreductase, partial [Penicillium malachiteum]